MKKQQIQVWTVRNLQGQYIGSYRVLNAERAIRRVIDEQMSMSSTFKKSHSRINLDRSQFTAKVET